MKESDDDRCKALFTGNRLRRRANVREISDVLKQPGGFDRLFIYLAALVIFDCWLKALIYTTLNYIHYCTPVTGCPDYDFIQYYCPLSVIAN